MTLRLVPTASTGSPQWKHLASAASCLLPAPATGKCFCLTKALLNAGAGPGLHRPPPPPPDDLLFRQRGPGPAVKSRPLTCRGSFDSFQIRELPKLHNLIYFPGAHVAVCQPNRRELVFSTGLPGDGAVFHVGRPQTQKRSIRDADRSQNTLPPYHPTLAACPNRYYFEFLLLYLHLPLHLLPITSSKCFSSPPPRLNASAPLRGGVSDPQGRESGLVEQKWRFIHQQQHFLSHCHK